MDDPIAIANAFAADAKKVVTETQDELVKAVKDINAASPTTFSAGDALKTMNNLVKIALNGGVAVGQTALQAKPTPGVLILFDHLATLVTDSINEAAVVGEETAELIGDKKFTRDAVVHTAIKLANIALLNGADAVQTIAAGPAQYAATVTKETYPLTKVDPKNARTITVGDVKVGGLGTPIPGYRIELDPMGGVLPPGATEFTLIINTANLASGNYVGTITVTGPDSSYDETIQVNLPL